MTVFATPVLDNFNRANETPLSAAAGWDVASWQTDAIDSNHDRLRIISNQVSGNPSPTTANFSYVQVRSSNTAADQECFVTLPTGFFPGGARIFLVGRGAAPGNPTGSCYIAGLQCTSSRNFPQFAYIAQMAENNIGTSLPSAFALSPVSGVPGNWVLGQKMGMRVWGSDPTIIELWSTVGGVWTPAARYVDFSATQIKGAGRMGIHLGGNGNQDGPAILDDFGGGAITAPTSPINTDAYPGYTGTKYDSTVSFGSKRAGGSIDKSKTLATLLSRRAWPTPTGVARPVVGQIWPYGGHS